MSGQDQLDYDNKLPDQLDSVEYVQKYDSKGHAVNPLSSENKRRQRHAQNDVLAVVGVCAKVSEKKPLLGQTLNKQELKTCDAENDSGLELRIFDSMLAALSESPAVNLRQRLQASQSLFLT